MLVDLKGIQLNRFGVSLSFFFFFLTDLGVPKMLDSCFSVINRESLVTGFEDSRDCITIEGGEWKELELEFEVSVSETLSERGRLVSLSLAFFLCHVWV